MVHRLIFLIVLPVFFRHQELTLIPSEIELFQPSHELQTCGIQCSGLGTFYGYHFKIEVIKNLVTLQEGEAAIHRASPRICERYCAPTFGQKVLSLLLYFAVFYGAAELALYDNFRHVILAKNYYMYPYIMIDC